MARYASPGRVDWIGTRSVRRAELVQHQSVALQMDGLEGDHASAGRRALTLIQAEHTAIIAKFAGRDTVEPQVLRRNIVVSGLNLMGFRNSDLVIGTATIRVTGPCPPCSRMEEALGHGGYTAMRGHGGVYAEIIEPGRITLGAAVVPAPRSSD